MLEELERRNFSQSTTITYIRTVEDFADYFHRPPDQLGPEHIREYQAQLFTHKHLSPNTVIQRLAALRFFFIKTLRKPWSIAETPYPKKEFHLPTMGMPGIPLKVAAPVQSTLCYFPVPGNLRLIRSQRS